jgi:hypothetical protein
VSEGSNLCLCGHATTCHDHWNYHSFCEGSGDRDNPCQCRVLVEIFDWPPEEGSYWIELCGSPVRCTVIARLEGGEIVVNNPLSGVPSEVELPQGFVRREIWWMKRSELESFGKHKFIKSEPNPFERYHVEKQAQANAGSELGGDQSGVGASQAGEGAGSIQ